MIILSFQCIRYVCKCELPPRYNTKNSVLCVTLFLWLLQKQSKMHMCIIGNNHIPKVHLWLILDCIDIHVELPRVNYEKLTSLPNGRLFVRCSHYPHPQYLQKTKCQYLDKRGCQGESFENLALFMTVRTLEQTITQNLNILKAI